MITFFKTRSCLLLGVTLPLVVNFGPGKLLANEPLVTTEEIQSAPLERRTRIVGGVTAALADDCRLAAHVMHEESGWSESQRAAFHAAMEKLNREAKKVRHAVKAAERADDDSWNEARSELAADFAEYTAMADELHALAAANTAAAGASDPRAVATLR